MPPPANKEGQPVSRLELLEEPVTRRDDGTSCSGHRRNARHWRGDPKALKAAGYKVAAATPATTEAAAKKFKADTGINVKWDVADYDACAAGLKGRSRPISVRSTFSSTMPASPSDGMFHKMTKDQWSAVINTNLNSLFNMTRPIWEGMRERKFGRVICISSINGQKGQAGQARLFRGQGRRDRLREGDRPGRA